jgi:predicted Rossmann fold flavoprotein
VTNHCFDNSDLVTNYPRGYKELQQVFARFNVKDTIEWFRARGVLLKTEPDGRMFPVSDNSQTIIDCFSELAQQLKIQVRMQHEVFSIQKISMGFLLKTSAGQMEASAVICCIGGHPKAASYHLLSNLGHKIVDPIPSLFTINLPHEPIKNELQGLSVQNAQVSIAGTRLNYNGPVLITHWGLSGPAVLKLSAFAAKEFYVAGYKALINVNWIFPLNASEAEQKLKQLQKEKHRSLPWSSPAFELPRRLWEFLCAISGIINEKPWAEVNHRQLRLLAKNLTMGGFAMHGKTTFKEEFVTSGGVDLKEVDFKTMQSRLVPGIYFCGEVLNIDGITGGFNFQSAWSTAWICSQSIN